MKIGDRIFVRGYIDEIRKDTIIIRNAGGYFGTIPSEVITGELPSAQPERTQERAETHACDLIDRQAAIDAIYHHLPSVSRTRARTMLHEVPSAQPEIIRCKDCEYGEQDEVGRWFCRSLGCQIGNEDGSGYCADALNRKEGAKDD